MSREIVDSIHEIQVEMMSEIHRVCKENGLRYSAICGTLLGAIRHKGFIPWDDDIDIGLPREDYDKLVKILQENPIKNCFLQCHQTDKHYYQPYAKLLRNDTVYIEEYRKNCLAKNGVFIDIFPFDSIKAPGLKKTKFQRMISRTITFSIWHKENCHMKRKGKKKVANIASAIIGILPKRFLVWWQNSIVIRKNKNWEYTGSMFSSNYETNRLYFKASDFDDLIEIPFENIVVNAPKNWDENLKRLYKNYMEFPPENKRNSGHTIYKVDVSAVCD